MAMPLSIALKDRACQQLAPKGQFIQTVQLEAEVDVFAPLPGKEGMGTVSRYVASRPLDLGRYPLAVSDAETTSALARSIAQQADAYAAKPSEQYVAALATSVCRQVSKSQASNLGWLLPIALGELQAKGLSPAHLPTFIGPLLEPANGLSTQQLLYALQGLTLQQSPDADPETGPVEYLSAVVKGAHRALSTMTDRKSADLLATGVMRGVDTSLNATPAYERALFRALLDLKVKPPEIPRLFNIWAVDLNTALKDHDKAIDRFISLMRQQPLPEPEVLSSLVFVFFAVSIEFAPDKAKHTVRQMSAALTWCAGLGPAHASPALSALVCGMAENPAFKPGHVDKLVQAMARCGSAMSDSQCAGSLSALIDFNVGNQVGGAAMIEALSGALNVHRERFSAQGHRAMLDLVVERAQTHLKKPLPFAIGHALNAAARQAAKTGPASPERPTTREAKGIESASSAVEQARARLADRFDPAGAGRTNARVDGDAKASGCSNVDPQCVLMSEHRRVFMKAVSPDERLSFLRAELQNLERDASAAHLKPLIAEVQRQIAMIERATQAQQLFAQRLEGLRIDAAPRS